MWSLRYDSEALKCFIYLLKVVLEDYPTLHRLFRRVLAMTTDSREFDALMRRIFGPCAKQSACEREFRHAGKCKTEPVRKKVAA